MVDCIHFQKRYHRFAPIIKAARPYYCPCCDSEVVVKAGFIKIPHFAHKSHASCHASSEPESPYHLLAKRKLLLGFVSHGYEAELEGIYRTSRSEPTF